MKLYDWDLIDKPTGSYLGSQMPLKTQKVA